MSLIFPDKKTYRRNCMIYVYLSFLSLMLLFFGFEIHEYWVINLAGGLFGFFIIPYLTTMIDFAS